MSKKGKKKKDTDEVHETDVLESAIVKIGHLLALGFGEAGGSIIQQNMSGDGDLDPMMPGIKTHAIFGFCIIDKFVETTEVLQEDVYTYVNRIAEIAHSMVDRFGGAVNKNIGDAFLMVWKFFDPEEIIELAKTGHFDNRKVCKENIIIADMAVFSTLKTIAKINKYD
mmetsp:Transcript_32583/g.49830  ORF Transcript_32583/g.49830 Transcript_32583/m.49830 type:complete len:168 (+) Transcript_32583:2381-2884(+)